MNSYLLGQIPDVAAPAVSPAIWDMLYVGAVAIGTAIIIFITVAVTRNRRQHRRRSKSGPEILKNSEDLQRQMQEEAQEEPEEDNERKHRRRRRRREHRPRNRTLAEAGGLPPERDPDSAPHTGL